MSETFDQAGLRLLVTKLVDGVGTDGDRRRLNEMLAESQEARRYYARLMVLQALLIQDGGSFPASETVTPAIILNEEDPPAAKLPMPGLPAPDCSAPATKSPVLGFLGGAVDYINHSRRLMFLLIAVMLSGWFIFQVGSVLIGRWWAGNADVADQPGETGPKLPGVGLASGKDQSHSKALAWLSGSVGGRWQVVTTNPAAIDPATGNPVGPVFWELGTEFVAGQQVNLVAGLGEITFRSGAKVVISAPAQFSVTSALATDLQLGKLTARVPHDSSNSGPSHPGGTGFTVNTSEGSVVDVGTEFGVEVTPEHKVDVQVFVGEVKVNAPSEGAGSGEAGEPGVHVTAGKTVHLEPGKPATLVESKETSRFQRDLTIASDSGDKALAAYLDFMRQLKPVVWLRMEGKDADRTIHDEMGNPDGKVQWDGAGSPYVEGRLGKGLWLRGPQLKDYAILPDYPKAEHGQLTVSAWAFADSRPANASIATNWGDGTGQFHFGLFSDRNSNGKSFDLRSVIMQADGKALDFHEGVAHLFPLNEWVHVAFVVDETMLRLYRDGREVASTKHAGLKYPIEKKCLGIGLCTNKAGDGPCTNIPAAYWSGKLDEIAIFNDALTAEQIKKLAAAPPR